MSSPVVQQKAANTVENSVNHGKYLQFWATSSDTC